MKRADFVHAFVLDQMSFDPASGYPRGDSIYFECTLCGDVVGSRAVDTTECSCGNLAVDPDTGRLEPRHGHGTALVFHAHPRSAGEP